MTIHHTLACSPSSLHLSQAHSSCWLNTPFVIALSEKINVVFDQLISRHKTKMIFISKLKINYSAVDTM